jgi:hypothetical protein
LFRELRTLRDIDEASGVVVPAVAAEVAVGGAGCVDGVGSIGLDGGPSTGMSLAVDAVAFG